MYNDIQGETTTFKELGFRIYNLPTLQKESLAGVTLQDRIGIRMAS